MGELRCPVCKKPNKDDAIVCEFCGARINPVTGMLGRAEWGGKPTPPSAKSEAGSELPPLPDWLGEIGEVPSEEGPSGDEHMEAGELPDWLGGLGDEVGAEASEAERPSGTLPDWFGRLSERSAEQAEAPTPVGPKLEPPDKRVPWSEPYEPAPEPTAQAEAPTPLSPRLESPDQRGPWLDAYQAAPEATAQAEAPTPVGPRLEPPDRRGSWSEPYVSKPEPVEPEPVELAPAEEMPAWLQRLRQKQAAAPEPEVEPVADAAGESSLRRALFRELPPAPLPRDASGGYDWLEKLRARQVEEAPPPEPEEEVLPPSAATASVDIGKRETPQWLEGMREVSPAEEGPPPGQVPDWLMEFAQESGIEDVEAAETPAWLQDIQPEAPALEGGGEPAGVGGEWLDELAKEGPRQPEAPPSGGVPSWMEDLAHLEDEFGEPLRKPVAQAFRQPEPAMPEAEPEEVVALPYLTGPKPRESWMEELAETPASAEAPPKTPALVAGPGDEEAIPRGEPLDLEAIQLPDWLGDLQTAGPPVEAAPSEPVSSLAPATLPAWLEAMRPVETFRPVAEVPEEEDTAVESAGPLAGLRGLLLAEPVVAMPRAGALPGSRLDITERQYAQAELLRRMVEEEQRELPAPAPAAVRPPLLRWLVGVFLVSMAALPLFWEGPVFARPAPDAEGRVRLPIELAPLAEMVNTLPVEKPVLMAFDYDPGYSGELEPVAGALLEHMVLRGLRIVTVSTQQTGPLLAERLIQRIGSAREYTVGRDYLHLGYLAGGPAALQLLVTEPRLAGLAGFYPRGEGYTEGSVWDSPVLQGVQRLSDFGLVVVITSGSQQARMWAEQVGPGIGGVPLAMVLSAGVEPMIRPYFDAADRSVDAILSGLPSAVKYEQLIQIPAIAASRWDTFGTGMIAAELLLIAGAAYGLIGGLLRPRGP